MYDDFFALLPVSLIHRNHQTSVIKCLSVYSRLILIFFCAPSSNLYVHYVSLLILFQFFFRPTTFIIIAISKNFNARLN